MLTDNEILKGLKSIMTRKPDFLRPYSITGLKTPDGTEIPLQDIIDLIHRQAAEKEELEFELIRSRNEMAAWKIRASWYKEKSSKLERKNSELEIELKAMRDAANSYKSEVERLSHIIACNRATIAHVEERMKIWSSEARKELAERLKLMAEKISIAGIEYQVITTESLDIVLAEMERKEDEK